MPNERERHLVVATIPAQTIAPVLAGERPGQFPLAGPLAHYAEWELVSHTFEVSDDGSAILTAVLETRVRSSSRRRQQAGSSSSSSSSSGGAPSKEERREQRKQERMQRKQERALSKQERRA
jgi:hypothetical protein